jgi:hypothetical protein
LFYESLELDRVGCDEVGMMMWSVRLLFGSGQLWRARKTTGFAAFAVAICSKLKVVKLVCALPPQSQLSSASAILGTASVIVFPRLAKSHETLQTAINTDICYL